MARWRFTVIFAIAGVLLTVGVFADFGRTWSSSVIIVVYVPIGYLVGIVDASLPSDPGLFLDTLLFLAFFVICTVYLSLPGLVVDLCRRWFSR